MSLLIINNLPATNEKVNDAVRALTQGVNDFRVVQAARMNILNCVGCKTCMFKTPGVCCLNDDYKKIEELLFEYDDVIFVSATSLGFLDYFTMRMFERRFAWAVVFCEYRENSIRHVLRYNNQLRIGLLYTGEANNSMLNEWLDLYTNHGNNVSIGAFHVDNVEEMRKCIL